MPTDDSLSVVHKIPQMTATRVFTILTHRRQMVFRLHSFESHAITTIRGTPHGQQVSFGRKKYRLVPIYQRTLLVWSFRSTRSNVLNTSHVGVAITRDFQPIASPPAPRYRRTFVSICPFMHVLRTDAYALVVVRFFPRLFCLKKQNTRYGLAAIGTRITLRECFRKSVSVCVSRANRFD